MLEQKSQIPEYYYLKTRWNDNPNRHYPWEENILKKTLTPHIYNNPNMRDYLEQIEDMTSLTVETNNIIRNFFNVSVDKYYNDHWN